MSDDEIKITEIPPALHNLMWSDFPEDYQHDYTVRLLRDAHNNAEAAWKRTLLAHRAAMADVTQTPDNNLQRSHRAAEKFKKQAESVMQPAMEHALKELDRLDAEMDRVPRMPSDTSVRLTADLLNAMSPEDRHKRVTEAIDNGEAQTVAAVLFFGDPWHFGLSQTKRDLFKAVYRQKMYPELVARRAAIVEAADRTFEGRKAYDRVYTKLIDVKRLDAAQALADAAKKALGE